MGDIQPLRLSGYVPTFSELLEQMSPISPLKLPSQERGGSATTRRLAASDARVVFYQDFVTDVNALPVADIKSLVQKLDSQSNRASSADERLHYEMLMRLANGVIIHKLEEQQDLASRRAAKKISPKPKQANPLPEPTSPKKARHQ